MCREQGSQKSFVFFFSYNGRSYKRNKMAFIRHTWFLVLILFGICSGITASRLEMIPKEKELIINEGDELIIKCKGKGRIQFSSEKITAPDVEKQSEYTVKFEEFSGTYVFKRPNAIGADTGWYACAEKGVEIRNDEQTIVHESRDIIRWIYVYVKSSTPFAVMGAWQTDVTILSGGRAVIPCRPTSPNLPVVLRDGAGELVAVDENISYDPKIGFIMEHVDGSINGAVYDCGIKGSKDVMPSYLLDVKPNDPLSEVVTDGLVRVITGANLTLHCNITMYKAADVTLSWQVPDSSDVSRWSANSTRQGGEYVTHIKDLTIKNIGKNDTGEYTCLAAAPTENRTARTVVEVMDPKNTYINWTVRGDQKLIEENENKDAIWIIDIKAFPSPTVEWYKDGRLLKNVSSSNSDLYKYVRVVDREQYFYRITKLNISDTGNYKIRIFTTNETKTIPLELIVRAKPVPRIDSNKLYYKPGEMGVFSCNSTGLPPPNVTWSFSRRISEENFTPSIPLNIQSVPVNGASFSVRYDLTSPVTAMGNLTCTSCNAMNCTKTTKPVFVSEGSGLFGIDCDSTLVTEGDDITLKCVASVYNYTDKIRWISNNSEILELIPERMSIRNVTTNFTFQSLLKIRKVAKADIGLYSCEAESKAGVKTTANYTLTVADSAPANITKVILRESKRHIDLEKEKYPMRNLTCEASGMPPPKVTWWKDGKRIMEFPDLKYKLLNNNSRLEIGPLSLEDSGKYSCIAENRLNRVERWVNIEIKGKSDNTALWISLICVLIVIIIVVITYMGFKVHRERVRRKILCEAGLTHFQEGALECLNPDLTVDDQAELLPYDKKWEFPREMLKLGKQLGSGAFGVVMKAEARGICVEGETTTVAVKMVRRTADPSYMKALSSELKIMIHLGRHLNVVNLLGACTKTILTKRELYVIVEYCRFGNLHNYLQRHRSSYINQIDPTTHKIDINIGKDRLIRSGSVISQNGGQITFSRSLSVTSSASNSGTELVYYHQGQDSAGVNMSPDGGILSNNSVQPGWRSNYRGDYRDQNLIPMCTQDLLCWAWQVASGMQYLSDRKVLHGDLAARNILLADDNIVKICDFGLAKNMYKDNNYKKKGDSPLPIKWMAIESIRDRIFSTQSDVWSFGIVLWEFFTLACTPYPGMEAETQYDKLIAGYRMERPEYATEEIYDFMLHCWKAKPSLRPSFPELAEKLGALLTDSIKMRYLDLNTPYMDMNSTNLQNGQSDYLSMMSSPNHDYYNAPDPAMEPQLDSNYLPMSPIAVNNGSCIFSPRGTLEDEVQFEFPPPGNNIPSDSGAGSSLKNPSTPEAESHEKILVDVQKGIVPLVDLGQDQTQVKEESGYFTDTSRKNSDKCPTEVKFLKNNDTDLSNSFLIHGDNNYVNMPKKKTPQIQGTADAFSNPSYVMMSKPEES